jgi:LETM1 and EF-hand domain-containing protein 1
MDHDGFVPLDHVLSLAEEEGLGIVFSDDDQDSKSNKILSKGKELRNDVGLKSQKPPSTTTSPQQPPSSPSPSSSSSSSNDSSQHSTQKDDIKPKKSDIVEDP